MKTTETLDKLYLEWSQFTTAETATEIKLKNALRSIQNRAATGQSVESAYINQIVNAALASKRD